MLSVKIEESYLFRKTIVAAAVMFGVVGGVAGGIGSSSVDAAPPREALLVRDDGGWGSGGGYCQITHVFQGSTFLHIVSCSTGTSVTEHNAG